MFTESEVGALANGLLNTQRHPCRAWKRCAFYSCCLGLLVVIGEQLCGTYTSASIADSLWPRLTRARLQTGEGSSLMAYGEEDRRPRVSVRGETSRKVPADEARLHIVVQSPTESTVTEAMAFVKERMAKIGLFLDELGFKTGTERQTNAYDLRPVWSQRPEKAPEDWERRILGYMVEQRTVIETSRLELVGDLMAKAAQHGASWVNLDGFFLSKRTRAGLREELLAEAVRNARGEALATATAAGGKLGPIQSINIDSVSSDPISPINYRMQARYGTQADFGEAPNIEAGELEVRASVSVVWQLAVA